MIGRRPGDREPNPAARGPPSRRAAAAAIIDGVVPVLVPLLAAAAAALAAPDAGCAPAEANAGQDAGPPAGSGDPDAVRRAVLAGYAGFAHRVYARSAELAAELRGRIEALVREPSAERLEEARRAWLAGREVYGMTEVLRFYSGPIDDPETGVETLVNAWPLDEAYVDAVEGRDECGIINDPARYPHLDNTLLELWNERGGEANVAVGWHAIEFLLWGQDRSADGPGARPYTDYVAGAAPNAERRGRYLLLCGDLLVTHLELVRDAWAPDAAGFRARFLAAPADESLRDVLAGMAILSGFEMAGERLAVAYETQDQEEEHSCFSDNTHRDFVANQRGILAVWRGGADALGGAGPGIREAARLVDPELARALDLDLAAALAAIEALPVPFDQAILGADDAPGRRAVLAALLALERQTETLAALALAFGFEIALHPGG
jgi:putative iron-regulated protein